MPRPPATDPGPLALAIVLPFLLLFEGIRRIGADKASLITLLGPAVTLLAAWAILDERLVLLQWAGFALVLAGMAVLQFGDRLWRRPIGEVRDSASRRPD